MNLYAWTDNDFTIYTNTETPTTSDNLYNADGEITTSLEENYGDAYIWSVSGDSIAVHFTLVRAVREFTRDPSKDILEPTPQYISNLSDGTNTYVIKDAEARTSISNLATVATSGSYNDLSDKPTIPAAQVNSDWNATSGKAQILNKPTIPTVPTITTSVSASSTNAETVGAKLFYDTCGNIESLINAL